MPVAIREESSSALTEYARVPIAFAVRERLVVIAPDAGLAGLHLAPEAEAAPWTKDYDADPASRPTAWAARLDVARCGILSAWTDGARAGGAVVARDATAIAMPHGRDDVAVLWDLRVAPALRGRGVGTALLRAAEAWAVRRGARRMMVETQNVNVPACRFYARREYVLGGIDRHAYPTLPDEVRLLWYRELPPRAGGR